MKILSDKQKRLPKGRDTYYEKYGKLNEYTCEWKLERIFAGIGTGELEYFCLTHKRFSGDNHPSHPKEKVNIKE